MNSRRIILIAMTAVGVCLGVYVVGATAFFGAKKEIQRDVSGPDYTSGSLSVQYWPDRSVNPHPDKNYTINCDQAFEFCETLYASDVFKEREGEICTEIYGGPDEAIFKGTIAGRPFEQKFSRTNGCEISRWEALQDALEVNGLSTLEPTMTPLN